MKVIKIIFSLFVLCGVILPLSCARVPVTFQMKKALEVKESKTENKKNDLIAEMQNIVTGGTLGPCENSFVAWLHDRVVQGLIPARKINGIEYAPIIPQTCRTIDMVDVFETGYKNAFAPSSSGGGTSGSTDFYVTQMDAWAKNLEKTPCGKQFLDPEKRKFTFHSLKMNVTSNTLSYPSPVYRLYYSTRKLTNSELSVTDAETVLSSNGSMKLFAETKSVLPGVTGLEDIPFVISGREKEEALNALTDFTKQIIAFPSNEVELPEARVIGGESFYMLPRGGMAMRILFEGTIKIDFSDAKCELDQRLEKIRQKDEKRRQEYEANNF